MSLTSLEFLVFLLVGVSGFYLIPKRFQWIWLLIFSYIYYLSFGVGIVFFLIYSTSITFLAGILLDRIKNSQADKIKIKKMKRGIVTLALLLNFGMLAFVKYTNFAIENINAIFSSHISFQTLILPIGISFYTFQSVAYVIDVYWEKITAERNPFKFALFVSFFPQILQGPIGRYSRLANQLYEKHYLDWEQIEKSILLILWGFFKKMVIADNIAPFVTEVFANYHNYSGPVIMLGVLCYSAQLYADFSGGMDVVMGVAGLFGVRLDENFKRPYFAVSITDFWHRWHITLGTWMKDYIFYPLSLSKFMGKFSKFSKNKFGKNIGRALPICIANIVVFLIVGIWHGAAWKYIVYGLFNGIIIGFSGLMAKNYKNWKIKFKISDTSKMWHVVQILRTFILVNISLYFDRADSLKDAIEMLGRSFANSGAISIFLNVNNLKFSFLVVGFGCIILLITSILQERGMVIRDQIIKKPVYIKFVLYLIFVFILPMLGQTPTFSGGFIYAQF